MERLLQRRRGSVSRHGSRLEFRGGLYPNYHYSESGTGTIAWAAGEGQSGAFRLDVSVMDEIAPVALVSSVLGVALWGAGSISTAGLTRGILYVVGGYAAFMTVVAAPLVYWLRRRLRQAVDHVAAADARQRRVTSE